MCLIGKELRLNTPVDVHERGNRGARGPVGEEGIELGDRSRREQEIGQNNAARGGAVSPAASL